MSQSPTDEDDSDIGEYTAGWDAIHTLLRQGGSWSGRETNIAYLNTGSPPFIDASAVAGLMLPDDGRALAATDWDLDGDIDLWTTNRTSPRVRFLRNNIDTSNRAMLIRLEGTTCNRDAVGARLELIPPEPDAPRQIRTIHAGDAFLSQSSKWVHFGLGDATDSFTVRVRWPGSTTETVAGLRAGRRYVIRQGTGVVADHALGDRAVDLTPSTIEPQPVSETARIVLANRLALPPLTHKDRAAKTVPLRTRPGRPTLINLWASWCAPCVVELSDFAKHAPEVQAAGIDILALSVDEPQTRARADALLERLDWPFDTGLATPDLLSTLEVIQRTYLERHRQLPLPCSFLIDASGNLAVIYKGPIEATQLIEDAGALSTTPSMVSAAHFPGIWHERRTPSRVFALSVALLDQGFIDSADFYLSRFSTNEPSRDIARAQLKLALKLDEMGDAPRALSVLQRAMKADPTLAEVYATIGSLLTRQGERQSAVPFLLEAISLKPELADAHRLLAVNYVAIGRLDDALTHYTQAVRLDPSDWLARFNLASTLARLGRPDEAIEHLRTVIELEPGRHRVRNVLAQLLTARGDHGGAIVAFEASLAIDANQPQILARLSLEYLSVGNKDRALELQQRLAAINPPQAAALLQEIRRRSP